MDWLGNILNTLTLGSLNNWGSNTVNASSGPSSASTPPPVPGIAPTPDQQPRTGSNGSGLAGNGFGGGGGGSWGSSDVDEPTPTPTPTPVIDPAKAAADAQTRRDIDLQQSMLDAAGQRRDTEKSETQSLLDRILGRYASETARNQSTFNEQSGVNSANYNRNLQESMLNAARGRQGLMGTLSALGALSGSGLSLMDQAVQHGASLDIAGAENTFRDNQANLTGAWNEYSERDKMRREDAQAQAEALKRQSENNYLQTQQDLYVKMANLYNSLGNAGQADYYTNQARNIASQLGSSVVPPTSSLSPVSLDFSPQSLGNYLGGVNDVSISQGTPTGTSLIPSLMASIRRREQGA